jgi:leucyl aminopeptidase
MRCSMKRNEARIAVLVAALIGLAAPGMRSASAADTATSRGAQARQIARTADPFATVYVVTSQQTYRGIRDVANGAMPARDSTGAPLMISAVRADRLDEIGAYVHRSERRCGGYFAFATRAEAEAFVRSDRAAQAVSRTLLAGHTLDNAFTVNRWLPQVQERRIYGTIDMLSGYRNRYYTSATGRSSAEWIRSQWQALAVGRSDVRVELFTACGTCSTQPSVILTVNGRESPGEVVVLGAHLDSINTNGRGSPNQIAPGADDDASGIATLTETLRIALADGWRPRRTVKFMGYAAEEVGLRGSKAIAQSFLSAGVNVVGVLQLDMTNYKSGAVKDMQLISDYSNIDLNNFSIALFDAYLAPRGYTRGTYTCGYACSDHASWTSAGYPSTMMFEAGDPNGDFPYIHTVNDTLATMGESAQNSVKFAQFALAFLGEMAKTSSFKETGGPAPPKRAP